MIMTVKNPKTGSHVQHLLTLEELGTFISWLTALHKPDDPLTITIEQSPVYTASGNDLEPPHYRYGGE